MEPNLHSRLLEWWKDNPADPDRPSLHNPDVQKLINEIAPGSHCIDLGGVMSLNVSLDAKSFVLRVHQPFVSRQRLLSIQQVRCRLADLGLVVPRPLYWNHLKVFRCGTRWAELEDYISQTRLKPSLNSYLWMFRALGTLHKALASLDVVVPRPLIATYGPPSSLQRWLSITRLAVQDDAEASDIVQLVQDLIRRLRILWIPANQLPQQLVHGDVRLSNVCQTAEGGSVYLDFGFLAKRPRVHDLAYSLAFMLLALNAHQVPESFAWQSIPQLVEEYEFAANFHLTPMERKALVPYTVAVPLYAAALDGFSNDPVGNLRGRVPFVRLSSWLLAHPEAMLG